MTGQQEQPTTTMNAGPAVPWHLEFAKVIKCTKCTRATDKNLLRDAVENVPQPGYIGARYTRAGLLLVGQNPAVPPANLVAMDKNYTAKLRAVREAPIIETLHGVAIGARRLHPGLAGAAPIFPAR